MASGLAELPHLSTFVEAVEARSFTAASASLGISQAAVSQRIAALEGELRLALFDRRAGRIALTEAGQRLYRIARRILDLHEEARVELGGVRPPISGELPIAASSVPGECFLPALLSAFHAEHPRVYLKALVGDSGSVIEDVVKGRASLGLVGRKAQRADLAARPIGRDSMVLVVPPDHPWAGRRAVSLGRLMGEPLIVREVGSGSRSALEKALERAGTSLDELNVALELGSNAAIKDAVKRGLGASFVSRFSVQRELASGELKAVAVQGLALTRSFYLIHHRRRPLSMAANAFLHFIESHPIDRRPARRP